MRGGPQLSRPPRFGSQALARARQAASGLMTQVITSRQILKATEWLPLPCPKIRGFSLTRSWPTSHIWGTQKIALEEPPDYMATGEKVRQSIDGRSLQPKVALAPREASMNEDWLPTQTLQLEGGVYPKRRPLLTPRRLHQKVHVGVPPPPNPQLRGGTPAGREHLEEEIPWTPHPAIKGLGAHFLKRSPVMPSTFSWHASFFGRYSAWRSRHLPTLGINCKGSEHRQA